MRQRWGTSILMGLTVGQGGLSGGKLARAEEGEGVVEEGSGLGTRS